MRFTEISESITSGSVSTVPMPLGKTQTRTQVSGLQPVQKVMGGTAKKKGPYANSISEGKKKVQEADLQEDDIIVVPGQGRLKKTGFVPHGQSRVDHEVEMAKSDLFQAAQNAEKVLVMIKHVSEDEGLEGWVQEKIIKANDYLNTVREYLEGKQVQGVSEGSQQVDSLVTDALKIMRGPELADAVLALKTVLGDREFSSRRGFYNFFIRQMIDMYGQKNMEEGQQFPDNSKSLAKRSIGQAEKPNAPKTASGHPTVANRFDGKAAHTRVEPTITQTKVKRKDSDKPIPNFLKKEVDEGAKVDRMVKHVKKSEKKLGHSDKEAENIAWATANKRGMLDNKNKKK